MYVFPTHDMEVTIWTIMIIYQNKVLNYNLFDKLKDMSSKKIYYKIVLFDLKNFFFFFEELLKCIFNVI